MSRILKDVKQVEEACMLVDIFASEYGWTIEQIENLTLPEISCLLRCILKRRGVKEEDLPSASKEDETQKLIQLAQKLKAKPEDIRALREGRKVTL